VKERTISSPISLGENPFSQSLPPVETGVVLPEFPAIDPDAAPDYSSIFPFVSKPSRYVGGEWNSIRKSEAFRKNAVGMCLCFPDLYETGFANMGVEILYRIVNRREDAWVERAYAPEADLNDILRRRGWPMFSLETRTPLSRFDIVGFSLPYELCFTNILEMMDLSGIPVRSAHRTERHPLIIGGGPCAVNPEPLADFFDAIVLGDGEDLIGEIVEVVGRFKKSKGSRQELLQALSALPGLYVPALYEPVYNDDGTIQSVLPKFPGVPEKVAYRKARLSDSNGSFSFPITPIVPFVQTVHDRLNVEIQRGCPWRCRFCQAGFTYSTYRERKKDELVQIVSEGLRCTGYDSVTLAGLSAADHTEIVPMLEALAETFTPKRIAIGLPSTRADRFTLALAEILQNVRRQSLTFAPEAGTERLRRVIRKELQESEIRETLRLAHRHGWKSVKLYFMYGLPTETMDDLEGIVRLVRDMKRDAPGLSLTITLSPFVPKPHTPYQWHAQDRIENHREKLAYLRKRLPAQIRAHGLDQIVLEGVLARGDRRCSNLLEKAWRTGAKFDEWSERYQPGLWQKIFEETRLTPEFFCYRPRSEKEVFPWDHLQGGPDRRALWNDYQTALRQSAEPVPAEPHVKPRPQVPAVAPVRAQERLEPSVQTLRVRFARSGDVRFLSHLEQIETIRRALRRADFPLAYSMGFHPQMKCAFGPAISVGYESDCEYFDLDLAARLSPEEFRDRFAAQMPEGFRLVSVSRVPVFFPSLDASINRVDYEVRIPAHFMAGRPFEEWQGELKKFLAQPDLALEKIRKGSRVRIPLGPLVAEARLDRAAGGFGGTLFLSLKFGPGKNVKPEKIAALFLNLSEEQTRLLLVKRRAFHIERPDGSLMEP
jgi:radical SAM family uncharacterized protein/radical SAM-linked protein